MSESCTVSVAFREPYITHQAKQFLCNAKYDIACHFKYFTDELPTKNGVFKDNIVSRFQESLYGFKPHAMQHAIDSGMKKVIWLDPSVLPTVSMQVLIDALDEHPLIIRSGEEPLAKMCNKKAKDWFGVTDEEIKNEKTCAGTIYGFNFAHPKAVEVFELWKRAEEEGIFGTQDDFMAGHWSDEACMGLALYKCGAERFYPSEFRYLNQKEL